MTIRIEAIILLLTLGLTAACGETGTPIVESPDTTPVDPEPSNNSDAPDPFDDGNNSSEPTCEPIAECPADACGSIDDGCGGTLDCTESCNCVDGAVQVAECGACGLGQTVCSNDETGAGDCTMPPIPNDVSLDEESCGSSIHFVDIDADTAGDGTREAPYMSLNAAVQAASDNDVIIFAAADGGYSEPVVIDRRVHVIGGYSESFQYDPESRSTLRVADPTTDLVAGASPTIGVRITDVSDPITLASLDIRTDRAQLADGATHAASNVAVWALDSDDVRVVNSRIESGDASNPPNRNFVADTGVDGARGQDAPSGGHAGAAGINSACSQANGGAGGVGGSLSFAPGSGDASPGGALGGTRGSSNSPGGTVGRTGTRGAAGGPGDHGSIASQVINGFWFPAETAHGDNGMPGRPGVGGGGGGGGLHEYTGDGTYKVGPGGGGGGAGGCGGEAGVGGLAGGASIAILLTNSELSLDASSEVIAGNGGRGQDGFQGGQGGIGGEGGMGTNRTVYSPSGIPTTIRWTSAAGGNGGDGGRGGGGGGGVGGPSYGVFCSGSDYSTESATEITSGAGGQGGARAGSTNRAPSGAEEVDSGC